MSAKKSKARSVSKSKPKRKVASDDESSSADDGDDDEEEDEDGEEEIAANVKLATPRKRPEKRKAPDDSDVEGDGKPPKLPARGPKRQKKDSHSMNGEQEKLKVSLKAILEEEGSESMKFAELLDRLTKDTNVDARIHKQFIKDQCAVCVIGNFSGW